MQPLINILESASVTCPIYAIFGNDDYDSVKDELQQIAGKTVTFLDDEIAIVKIRGKKVAIVGSRGVLDQPTYWQARNIPNIREHYKQRVTHLDKLLGEASNAADFTILLTHYTPTYTTLHGEIQRTFAQMGSRRVEKLLTRHTPTFALHGHAHRGRKSSMVHGITGKVPVFNIALPLNKRIVIIEFPHSK